MRGLKVLLLTLVLLFVALFVYALIDTGNATQVVDEVVQIVHLYHRCH